MDPEIFAAAAAHMLAAADMGSICTGCMTGRRELFSPMSVGRSVTSSIASGIDPRRGNHSLRVLTEAVFSVGGGRG
jgi:hypothetical protein